MSANDLADRLDAAASRYDGYAPVPRGYVSLDDVRAAAALLREQADQLDTLRNAVAAHQDCCLTDFWPELREVAAAGGGVPEEGAADEHG